MANMANRVCQFLAWALCWRVVRASTEMEPKPDKLHRDFHNVFVFGILGLVVAWVAKVVFQLVRAVELNVRLSRARSLQLEAMSIYVHDFQMLIRQHFNQILRLRRTVPPKLVTRHELTTHVHPESISCMWVGEEDSGGGPMGFGVEFDIDASAPCCVRLYWGVSAQACNDFVQRSQAPDHTNRRQGGSTSSTSSALRSLRGRWTGRTACTNPETTRSLLEMEELGGPAASSTTETSGSAWTAPSPSEASDDPPFSSGSCFAQSRDFFLPAGCGQRYVTPAGDLIHPGILKFDMSASWLRPGQGSNPEQTIIPLAIVVLASRSGSAGQVQGRSVSETKGQISLVKFQTRTQNEGSSPYHTAEVIRQFCFCDANVSFDVQGIYGFEDPGESDCMICYARPKNVVLLPCRHCSVCHSCLRSLRDEKCPLCRSSFSSYMTCPVSRGSQTLSQARERGPQGGQTPQGPPTDAWPRRGSRPEEESLTPLTLPEGHTEP